MDEETVRELMRSPLDDDPGPRRGGYLGRMALAVVVAVVVAVAIYAVAQDGSEDEASAASEAPAEEGEAADGAAPASLASAPAAPSEPGYPEPAAFNQAVYDPATERVVLSTGSVFEYGDPNPSGALVDGTWGYGAGERAWYAYPGSPPPRAGYAAAVTADDGGIVLFGGTTSSLRTCGRSGPCGTEALGDTWLMDTPTGGWRAVASDPAPAARYGAAMAYDERSGRVVLFGGATMSDGTFGNDMLGDTWLFDPETRTWNETFPPEAPAPRAWHRMGYDPGAGLVLLFGGSSGDEFDERVWAYDVGRDTWSAHHATGPSGRWTPIAAFYRESGVLVVAGGQGAVVSTLAEGVTSTEMRWLGDVWTYSWGADEWTELAGIEGLIPWSSGAYDPATDRVVVHVDGVTGLLDADTGSWEWIEGPAG